MLAIDSEVCCCWHIDFSPHLFWSRLMLKVLVKIVVIINVSIQQMEGYGVPKPKLICIIVILHIQLNLFVIETEIVIELEQCTNCVLWCWIITSNEAHILETPKAHGMGCFDSALKCREEWSELFIEFFYWHLSSRIFQNHPTHPFCQHIQIMFWSKLGHRYCWKAMQTLSVDATYIMVK